MYAGRGGAGATGLESSSYKGGVYWAGWLINTHGKTCHEVCSYRGGGGGGRGRTVTKCDCSRKEGTIIGEARQSGGWWEDKGNHVLFHPILPMAPAHQACNLSLRWLFYRLVFFLLNVWLWAFWKYCFRGAQVRPSRSLDIHGWQSVWGWWRRPN